MDQIQQPKGNFIASPLRYQMGNRPAYRGKVTIPGTERAFEVALWSRKYIDQKTGEEKIVLSGRTSDVSISDDAMAQVDAIASRATPGQAIEEAGMKLEAGQITLFANGFKSEPGVDAEQLAKRPNFYGRWNPGNGEKVVSVSVWARKGRDGGAFLAGATQYPLPGKEAGREEAAERSLQDLVETGEVTKGTAKLKARGGRAA